MPAAMERWGRLSHLFATVFMAYLPVYLVFPAVADVTVEAVCGGEEECSLAIYLTGVQLAITGFGAMLMMPIIGNLSDAYGRKKILTIPLTLQIIPLLILAWKRTTNFFYAYCAIKILTEMIVGGGVLCISFSFFDNVAEGKRVAAFAVLTGVMSIANVCGTLAAGLLSLSLIFQVASVIAILAAIYMRVFLKDSSIREKDCSELLILSSEHEKKDFIHRIPSPKDVFRLLIKSSTVFTLAASVCFFNSVGEAGAGSFLMYYLKMRFHFNKDQFSLLFLIMNVGATITNVILMPLLGPFIGEQTFLCFGLFNGVLSLVLESIAWAPWVRKSIYFSYVDHIQS